jgi:hypothetical protein
LHVACGFGAKHAVKLLLNCPETDVNLCTRKYGETAAMHCIRYQNSSAACFELLFGTRLLEMDLDIKATDGQTLGDKIRAMTATSSNSRKIQAVWTASIFWFGNQYLPSISQILATSTSLLSPLVRIIVVYLTPQVLSS